MSHNAQPSTSPTGLVFIHIMKTGGGSLNARIAEGYGTRQVFPEYAATPDETLDQKISVRSYIARGDRRDEHLFHTLHMPAVVADLMPHYRSAIVLRDPVARTVSHLRQMRNVVGADQLELDALYDREGIREALANYQARVLATEVADVERFMEIQSAVFDVAPTGEMMAELVMQMTVSGIPQLAEAGLFERANARLRSFDFVGVTEQLAAFQRRIEQAHGWAEAPVIHDKATTDAEPVSEWLVTQIAADNPVDVELYEVARDLAEGTLP